MIDYKEKVKQLKNSFSVEGVPLIKSDRFTDEELAKMKKASSAHSSHWYIVIFGVFDNNWVDLNFNWIKIDLKW